jgi:hypothetical protein
MASADSYDSTIVLAVASCPVPLLQGLKANVRTGSWIERL